MIRLFWEIATRSNQTAIRYSWAVFTGGAVERLIKSMRIAVV